MYHIICQKGFPQRKNRARYLSGPDPVSRPLTFFELHEIGQKGFDD
jgi:hypothetical protein